MSRFKAKPIAVPVETEDFGVVHVRPLTATEYLTSPGGDSDAVAAVRLVAMSLCEPDGTPIEVDEADVGGWPLRTFDPIAEVVLRLNGLEKKVSANLTGSPTHSPSDSTGQTSSGSSAN